MNYYDRLPLTHTVQVIAKVTREFLFIRTVSKIRIELIFIFIRKNEKISFLKNYIENQFADRGR
jgi:hypothetical protein